MGVNDYKLSLLYQIRLAFFPNAYLNAHQWPTTKSQARITSS